MLIGHSKEHKILTVIISSAKVKNTELSLGECSLFGRKKKNFGNPGLCGRGCGEGKGPSGKNLGNNYSQQLSERVLFSAVG